MRWINVTERGSNRRTAVNADAIAYLQAYEATAAKPAFTNITFAFGQGGGYANLNVTEEIDQIMAMSER